METKNILILGGNRFFGRKLTERLLEQGHKVTLVNRGSIDDGFAEAVTRIQCDRNDSEKLRGLTADQDWDIIYDQICFDYSQAKAACKVFSRNTKKYIFTSSQSVYAAGAYIKEENFDPENHKITKPVSTHENYAEAKRQAEKAFYDFAGFPIVVVRFPIVIGDDDYTGRFLFHLNRIRDGIPIYFPNMNAKISFISSGFAAETLLQLGESELTGPVNAASPEPIELKQFIEILEQKLGKSMVCASEPSESNISPYGIAKDWFMDCGKLNRHGINGKEIKEWLLDLI